jgi:hypothetical protein
MMIRELLAETISDWERLGHPALMERFVLRNGKLYTPRKRVGRRGKPKECYCNSTHFVIREQWKSYPYGHPTYVEGFTIGDIPFAIAHAWVTMTGADAMDPTLESSTHQYFGVAFPTDVLLREIKKNRVYGILDTGVGLNHELIFAIDPELRDICNAVIAKHKRRKQKEKAND